ncbi:hypothetical protein RFM26_17955 [Mesorhizobium sp. VK23B]|uniref:Uncharacterized protein n=1 Tax=Mesorhizobium dulcispinae TaxID=3072316 RepID=A0ABU4XGH6_9HYPH|nr:MULTISPECIES: hypothetical protein [unclassified Mesorhizobium]MDX8467579.1 hypothetical protein [Mesorhizobium sp. VK23B]MDX8473865.1 hypothetical protein [Mesorhizobium sp. VK23A]
MKNFSIIEKSLNGQSDMISAEGSNPGQKQVAAAPGSLARVFSPLNPRTIEHTPEGQPPEKPPYGFVAIVPEQVKKPAPSASRRFTSSPFRCATPAWRKGHRLPVIVQKSERFVFPTIEEGLDRQ